MDDELKEFTNNLAEFIVLNQQRDPLIMGAALMMIAIEIYTHSLNDDEIYNLLNVVAESVREIREKSLIENKTLH